MGGAAQVTVTIRMRSATSKDCLSTQQLMAQVIKTLGTWCRTSCVECSRNGGLDVGGRAWNISFKDAVQQPQLMHRWHSLTNFRQARLSRANDAIHRCKAAHEAELVLGVLCDAQAQSCKLHTKQSQCGIVQTANLRNSRCKQGLPADAALHL